MSEKAGQNPAQAPQGKPSSGSGPYKLAALTLFVVGTGIAVWLAWGGWVSIRSCSTPPFDAARCGNNTGGYYAIVGALFLLVAVWGAAGKVWNRQ